LAQAGLTIDAVVAQALSTKLDDFERIDRMIAMADGRRDKVLREIEARRESLARCLREVSRTSIDAETLLEGAKP
jgi:hypothetical protein